MQFKECNDNTCISIFYAMIHYTQECNSYLKTKLSNIYWCIEYQLCIPEFSRSHLFSPSPWFSLLVSFSFSFSPPAACLFVCQKVCKSVRLSVCQSLCLSACLSLFSFILSLKLIFCCKIKIKTLRLMQMSKYFLFLKISKITAFAVAKESLGSCRESSGLLRLHVFTCILVSLFCKKRKLPVKSWNRHNTEIIKYILETICPHKILFDMFWWSSL